MSILRAAWSTTRVVGKMSGALAGLLWARKRAVSRFRSTLSGMGVPPEAAAVLAQEYAAIVPGPEQLRRITLKHRP